MRHRIELQQLTIYGPPEVVATLDLSPTWGGARKGAGRPKGVSNSDTISIRVPTELKSLLVARAAEYHMTLSEYLVQMIRDCECPE